MIWRVLAAIILIVDFCYALGYHGTTTTVNGYAVTIDVLLWLLILTNSKFFEKGGDE